MGLLAPVFPAGTEPGGRAPGPAPGFEVSRKGAVVVSPHRKQPLGITPVVLELLEFTKIASWLAELTSAPTSEARARAIAPATDVALVERGLGELSEGRTLAETRGPWPGPPAVSLVEALGADGAASVAGALYPARVLYQTAELLAATERAQRYWDEARAEAPAAAALARGLAPDPALEKRLRASVDAEGQVLDGASSELAGLRKQMRVVQGRLREKLDRYKTLAADEGTFVTQRNERFVVAVRADRFERSRGLVHDVSASGATLFVEPFEVCTMNNELAEIQGRERNEIARVLRALSDLVRAGQAGLESSENALAATDLLWARVRLAKALGASLPRIEKDGRRLVLHGARHPLLWRDADGERHPAAARKKVVPLSLVLEAPQHILLVSGPNMGGKTVALKTLGLCALMAQAGLGVPADEGAVLPLFTTVLADIGDAQSIELHLSTFAAHLGRLNAMAKAAAPGALFLADEIGSGTDPAEGAALGRALLKHFAHRGAWAVATTHLGSLKVLAHEDQAVVNASMALDPDTLAPRYELVLGVPGGSHALHIAERLGFEKEVLAEARRDLPEAARSLEALLADVTRELVRATEARTAYESAEARAREAARALEEERQTLHDEARKAGKERMFQIRALESQVQGLLRELKNEARSEEKSRARIQEIEAKARSLGRESDRLTEVPAPIGGPAELVPGATVYVRDLGVTARVIEGPDAEGRVVLERGDWRIQSRADQCFAPENPDEPPGLVRRSKGARATPAARVSLAEATKESAIDVRGMDQEEALKRLEDGLDRAVLAGLDEVRIVHGVGRGILREAVAKALRLHPHVEESRLGGHGEGGRGVTVVRLR